MGLTLLDSSAVIAFLVMGDALRPSAIRAVEDALNDGDRLVMSAVTWNETLYGALLGHLPEPVLREFAEDLGVRILPADAWVAERAASLRHAYRQTRARAPRPRLRTADALILATSIAHPEIGRVICGDEQWTKVPGVTAEVVLLRA